MTIDRATKLRMVPKIKAVAEKFNVGTTIGLSPDGKVLTVKVKWGEVNFVGDLKSPMAPNTPYGQCFPLMVDVRRYRDQFSGRSRSFVEELRQAVGYKADAPWALQVVVGPKFGQPYALISPKA